MAEQTADRPIIEAAQMERRVSELLRQLGVPAHIDGYHYLRAAILLTLDGGSGILPATAYLYPAVADLFRTTPTRVERAIRSAITVAWERGDVRLHNEYFGCTVRADRDRPTNKEFIATIVDSLRLETAVR